MSSQSYKAKLLANVFANIYHKYVKSDLLNLVYTAIEVG